MNSNKCDVNDNNINPTSDVVQLEVDDDKETTDLKGANANEHNEKSTLKQFDQITITDNKYTYSSYPSSLCAAKHIGKTLAFWFDSQGNPFCIIGPNCNVTIFI